jgi:hypothetical protein
VRWIDADDPRAAYVIGRHLAREYWRGFRWGTGVAAAVVIAACVAEAIR